MHSRDAGGWTLNGFGMDSMVSQSVSVAVTGHHRLDGLKPQNVLSGSSGGWKLKAKRLVGPSSLQRLWEGIFA